MERASTTLPPVKQRQMIMLMCGILLVSTLLLPAAETIFARPTAAPGTSTLAFTTSASSIGEGDGSALLTIDRSGGTDGAISARVDVAGGTASDGLDYQWPIGLLDSTFNTGAGFNGAVQVIVPLDSGKIIAGGDFTSYKGTSYNRIVQLNTDGSVDSSFSSGTGFNGYIWSVVVQTDGKILVGGNFTAYDGVAANYIVRLNSDGTRDTSFAIGTGFDQSVRGITLQPDGNIIVSGWFSTYNGASAGFIVRLESDGTKDATFTIAGAGLDSAVYTAILQPDGKILIGGNFWVYNNISRNYIARLNSDGSLDTSFVVGTGFDSVVNTIAIQPDGKIFAGGEFTSYNGTTSNRIIRLDSNGTFDISFNTLSGFNNGTYAILLQPDSKILVAGYYTMYNTTHTNNIARINPDGSLDSSFNTSSGFDNGTLAIAFQDYSSILVGGVFTAYQGTSAKYIARIQGDMFVNWKDGETGSKTINLPIIDDSLVEGAETVDLSLSVFDGATLGSPGTHTLTIIDNDIAPTSTPTPSNTPTNTPTITPSSTPSNTPTITPSSTPSNTPTITPSSTPTATPSNTPTATPSSTPSSTPSNTPTITPSSTPTITPTPATIATPTPAVTRVYIPLIMREPEGLPDLVVESIAIEQDELRVVIRNQGTAAATAPFWVDAYLSPSSAPTSVNQIWPDLGSDGLAWGVTARALPLAPGAALTLTLGDAYYLPSYSRPTGDLAAGARVYAQVDSLNLATTYGAVLETHERDGGPYNNIATAVVPAGGLHLPSASSTASGGGAALPERQKPE